MFSLQRIAAVALASVLSVLPTVDAQSNYRTIPVLPGVSPAGVETIASTSTFWMVVDEGLDLVYAQDPPRIAVIDGPSNRILRHIDVGQPIDSAAVDPVHNRLYLMHGIHRQISVVDAVHENVIETIDLAFGAGGPAVDPVHEELYLVGGNALWILDARDGDHQILHTVALPGSPGLYDIDPVRRRAYVIVGGEIVVVNTHNGEVLFTVPLPPVNVPDMAVNSLTGLLYVTTLNANSVMALDVSRPPTAREPPVVAEVFLGEQTFSVDVDALNNRIYVLEHQGPLPGTLWIVNGDTHQIENTIQLSVDGSADPDLAKNMCWDSHHMDANPITGRVYASCPVGKASHVAVIPMP
jgi:DNA-binding beta-propeller fold protein YncE